MSISAADDREMAITQSETVIARKAQAGEGGLAEASQIDDQKLKRRRLKSGILSVPRAALTCRSKLRRLKWKENRNSRN
jgi:hypothetical protein